MNNVLKILTEYQNSKDTFFVFPSDIAAKSWARKIAFLNGAVDLEKFIGWDVMKADYFSPESSTLIAANKLFRYFFSLTILQKNADNPFLNKIIYPEYAKDYVSFAKLFVKILPTLESLNNELQSKDIENIFSKDYILLWKEYSEYLSTYSRYEPQSLTKKSTKQNSKYFIFWPELIEDFCEYENYILSNTSIFTTIKSETITSPKSLHVFDSSILEIRYVFTEISRLLHQGVLPKDITLTIPNYESIGQYVEREAKLFDIPISVKIGRTLSDWPSGGLFRAIKKCADEYFSFSSLKELLLDSTYPYKISERKRATDLINIGIELNAVAPWPENNVLVDLWEETFKFANNTSKYNIESILSFYRGLKKQVLAITQSKSFQEVKNNIMVFGHTFFDDELWTENERVYERILIVLEDLSKTEQELFLPEQISRYNAFITYLENVMYVYTSSQSAISIYPYRPSCGINVKYHYILNCAQQDTTVHYSQYSFLRPDIRSNFNFSDIDVSASFLDIYSKSGENVFFSFSILGPNGFQIAHPYFFNSQVKMNSTSFENPWSQEIDYWINNTVANGNYVFTTQKKAFDFFTTFSPSSPSWISDDTKKISSSLIELCLSNIIKENYLTFSITHMQEYTQCKFKFFLKYICKIQNEKTGVNFADAIFIGNAQHLLLQKVFEFIKNDSLKFDVLRSKKYIEYIPYAMEQTKKELKKENGAFIGALIDPLLGMLNKVADNAIDLEAQYFPEFIVQSIEHEDKKIIDIDNIQILFKGFIDRIAQKDDEIIIIDYKKSKATIPSIKQMQKELGLFMLNKSNYEIVYLKNKALQLIAYLELQKNANKKIKATYYDITENKYKSFLGRIDKSSRQVFEYDDYKDLNDYFNFVLTDCIHNIKLGCYSRNSIVKEKQCESCDFSSICRLFFIY